MNLEPINRLPQPIVYKGTTIDSAFRADPIVENQVLVALKAIEAVLPVHDAQILSYIRETGHPVGRRINFHGPKLVDGITRIVNDRSASEPSANSGLKIPVQGVSS